ncbi:hypothetical protein BU16DRAFT_190162 [Lophium mytilinum]|uniref:Uncharacterized protein n=1 Tax=Lophium mytilinum TaxID=390894 RepID=A0A6A6R959_9PEZI|nr:hypothetical protein BU16DRAFT_190162 [Lophium mytilinum]
MRVCSYSARPRHRNSRIRHFRTCERDILRLAYSRCREHIRRVEQACVVGAYSQLCVSQHALPRVWALATHVISFTEYKDWSQPSSVDWKKGLSRKLMTAVIPRA